MESDVREVALARALTELKRRLEVLLGAKPHAPVDKRERTQKAQETQVQADRKQRMLGGWRSAPRRGGALARRNSTSPRPWRRRNPPLVRNQLAGAVDTDPAGRPVLALTLPDRATLDGIAHVVASLLTRVPAAEAVVN